MHNLSYSWVIVQEKEKRNGILWASCIVLKGGKEPGVPGTKAKDFVSTHVLRGGSLRSRPCNDRELMVE